jgi:hypothetical protein
MMMKLGLISLAIASLVCACAIGSSQSPATAQVSDAGLDSQPDITAPIVVDVPDAGQDASYQECATITSKPVTTGSAQAQNCLTEQYCTDSLGQTYLRNLHDSCHDLDCRWALSCSGLKTYCLPENEQSSPEYADDLCTKPIALVAFKNGQPTSKYVGLDQFASNVDAGDAGWYSCVDIYTITNPWKGTGDMYYLSLDNGTWTCNSTYLQFPGTKMYYLSSSPINTASQFVER